MLKQILFIYRDEFVTKLIEKLMQEHSIGCYGISSLDENFSYVIDDIEPDLVLIDEKSYSANKELIESSLNQASFSFKSVLLAESPESFDHANSGTRKFDYSIGLPLDLSKVVDQIRSLA